ncbi:peptidylprolyl isomerase [Sphingomicrobium clamense]|uniref:peptidylprolyl isomerase n=1 Tax=Sphingomicrobium clamense TaxID=2851013 RepID=A0ABS6V2Q1_9SPHN|nr:peptidylprolyl isomerase [Sphingomicrobium sp. B8]MBW0143771.1 peptidylprolyl isomerase [Sphingomicrobium sp. B8]
MTNRLALAAIAAASLFAAPASAQEARPAGSPPPSAFMEEAAPEAASVEQLVRVRLSTEKGDIVLALDEGRAPITVANFLAYLDKGWLDGQPFYRAMPFGEGGLIQGGVRDGSKLLPPIEHEASADTGLKHERGTISMANAGPGTARNDFFIMLSPVESFDASFAPFGQVIEGMDVVEAIFNAPVDPEAGEGAMKGQMIADPIEIVSATRIEE